MDKKGITGSLLAPQKNPSGSKTERVFGNMRQQPFPWDQDRAARQGELSVPLARKKGITGSLCPFFEPKGPLPGVHIFSCPHDDEP
jgi:hypothetical protein